MKAPAGDGLTCPVHPGTPATAACVDCGRLVCAACRRVGDDGLTRCLDRCGVAPGAEQEVEPGAGPHPGADPPPEPTEQPPGEPTIKRPPDPRPERPVERPVERAVAVPAPHRPPEAGPPPPVVEGPTPIPWEHPGVSKDAVAFVRTVREALLGPTRYMGRIPWLRGDLFNPLLFALMAGIIGQVGLVVQSVFMPLPAPITLPGLPALPAWVALLLALPLSPLIITASLYIKAGLGHLLLRMAGQPPRPFEATFRVFAYAEVASLLLVVPMLGLYASRFYVIFLLLTGLRFAQGAGFAAALLAMLPTLVLQWVLV